MGTRVGGHILQKLGGTQMIRAARHVIVVRVGHGDPGQVI